MLLSFYYSFSYFKNPELFLCFHYSSIHDFCVVDFILQHFEGEICMAIDGLNNIHDVQIIDRKCHTCTDVFRFRVFCMDMVALCYKSYISKH